MDGLRAGAMLQTLEGIVRAEVRRVDHDAATGRFEEEVVWHDSYVAEQHVHHYGKSVRAGVLVAGGYASGYVSACLGQGDLLPGDVVRRRRAQGTAVGGRAGRGELGRRPRAIRADFQAANLGHEVERLRKAVQHDDCRTWIAASACWNAASVS